MQSLLVIGAASQLLAACNTTSALHVQKAQAPTESASLRAADSVATFALDRIVNGIARRDPIFAFPGSPPTSRIYCNITYFGDENVSYANGKRYLGDWSSLFGEIFHEEMIQKGFRVEGDPKAVFSHARQVNQSEYLIGGRLKSMKGNFCQEHTFWNKRPTDLFSGELYVEVEWSVLDTLSKEIALTKTFNGFSKIPKPRRDGITRTFEQAFADTVEKLATDPQMVALAGNRDSNISQNGTQAGGDVSAKPAGVIRIGAAPRARNFAAAKVGQNVVTVRIGRSHGSGFFVGRDGYVLTNSHVVGSARRVQLIMSDGSERPARVLNTDKKQDVALLKTDIKRPTSLAIEPGFPKVAETVYAIGSPAREGISSTVTKGIVSAKRVLRQGGPVLIQSDAAIPQAIAVDRC